jgi:predicted alpha/beta-hydrolase family hydrolase
MTELLAADARFPSVDHSGTVRGLLHTPEGTPSAGLVLTHGRSGHLQNPVLRRIATAAADAGLAALRMNFRYTDEKGIASRDLAREEDDLRGAIRFLSSRFPEAPIFLAGQSMGARVCARASADPLAAGIIALGYPLHPRFRPEVENPPEWPKIVKPILFVQGDHDPFCDLARLTEDLRRLAVPHELVVIRDAGHSFEPKGGKRDTLLEVRDAVLDWIARFLA